jgi:hypothetical protein
MECGTSPGTTGESAGCDLSATGQLAWYGTRDQAGTKWPAVPVPALPALPGGQR